jgi:hypothetical protein
MLLTQSPTFHLGRFRLSRDLPKKIQLPTANHQPAWQCQTLGELVKLSIEICADSAGGATMPTSTTDVFDNLSERAVTWCAPNHTIDSYSGPFRPGRLK